MTYATQLDFKNEFGTDDLPDNLDRLERSLARASRLSDTFCRSAGIETPIQDPVIIGEIKGYCLDIARYYLWNDNPSEEIRTRYEDSVKFFESVSTGKVKFIGSKPPVAGGLVSVRLVRG